MTDDLIDLTSNLVYQSTNNLVNLVWQAPNNLVWDTDGYNLTIINALKNYGVTFSSREDENLFMWLYPPENIGPILLSAKVVKFLIELIAKKEVTLSEDSVVIFSQEIVDLYNMYNIIT